MEILPVTRSSYKVFACVEGAITSVGRISDLTRIDKAEVKKSLALLAELALVERKGALVFTERKVTADGVRALAVYQKVYGNDGDVNEVLRKIEEEGADGS
jgi:RIO-like serine/threonine protein kinase